MHRTVSACLLLLTFLVGCTVGPPSSAEGGGPGPGGGGGKGGVGGAGGISNGTGGTGGSDFDPCSPEVLEERGPPATLVGDPCYAELLPKEQRWLVDPDTWKPMPGEWNDLCRGYEALPDKLQFEPLQWEPCGPACERADLWQGWGNPDHTAHASVRINRDHQVTYIKGSVQLGGRSFRFARFIDLESGRTEAALALDMLIGDFSYCYFLRRGGLDFMAVQSETMKPGSMHIDASWNTNDQAWTFRSPGRDGTHETYCDHGFMEDGYRRFFFCGHGVFALLEPTSSHVSRVDHMPNNYALKGDGEGNLIAWPEFYTGTMLARIRGWAPDGQGPRTLLDKLPRETCAVALSDTHMVGFKVDLEWAGGCDAYQPNGRFWVTERTSSLSQVKPSEGPVLSTIENGVYRLTTWGPYIAAVLHWPGKDPTTGLAQNKVVISRVGDWKTRWLTYDGLRAYDAAVSSDYLYVAPTAQDFNWGRTRYLYRYDLSRFDEIGTEIWK